ncbi:hypothetical protein ACFQZK_04400 [Rhodococcus aetherivorans]
MTPGPGGRVVALAVDVARRRHGRLEQRPLGVGERRRRYTAHWCPGAVSGVGHAGHGAMSDDGQ